MKSTCRCQWQWRPLLQLLTSQLLLLLLLLPLLLAVCAGRCSFAAASALPASPCALLREQGVSASAVPPGWSPEAWQDALREAFPDEAERPLVCIPPPDSGEYHLTNPIDEQAVANLGYTARDWSRWDGHDTTEDLLFKPAEFSVDNTLVLRKRATPTERGPTVWGIGDGSGVGPKLNAIRHPQVPLSQQAPADTLGKPITGAIYLRAMRAMMANTFYPRGYAWFRGFGRNRDLDWIVEMKKTGRLDLTGTFINVSYALNENYNVMRKAQRTVIRNRILGELRAQNVNPASRPVDDLIDSEWDATRLDWRRMPRNQATLDWFERILDAKMAKMCLTPGTLVWERDQLNTRRIDAYGLFEGMDGTGYSQGLGFFYAHDWAWIATRWIKLLRTPVIRKIRATLYASLAASRAAYLYRIDVEDRLSNQWLLRVGGVTSALAGLLRSEAVLRARGEWQNSVDGVAGATTDWERGRVTTADAHRFAEDYLGIYVDRLERLGLIESLSTYYRTYEMYERVLKVYNYDLYTNFMPQAASMSGPSGRHFDQTTGLHGRSDYWDTPLYAALMFPPYCAVSERKERHDGSVQQVVVNLCTAEAQLMPPLTVQGNDFSIPRMLHSTAQAAGLFYLPFDVMVNYTISAPMRTTLALTTNQRGQERFNFFSPAGPGISMGFSGEEAAGVGNSMAAVARLGGAINPGTPPAIVKQKAPSRVHAYMRLMLDKEDDPFFRASTYSVVAHDRCQQMRILSTQHQGFMLNTLLVAGRSARRLADVAAPWSTNLMLPLTTDALWADDKRLPTAAGSVVALPLNTIITVRHKDGAVVMRVLRLEVSSPIKHATSIQSITGAASQYAPKVGKQEFSLTWQVDASSIMAGSGRIVMHHKHRGDSKERPWRVAVLWGSGRTANDAQMHALQRSLRHAVVSESIREGGGWDINDQPSHGRPARSWDGRSTLGSARWELDVQIGPSGANRGGVHLKLVRTDVYQPNSNDNVYRHLNAPMHVAPYYFDSSFQRVAQGQELFRQGATALFNGFERSDWTGRSTHTLKHNPSELLAPHHTAPLECVPGVDSPCFQWRLLSSWSSCSASCRGGVRSRTVRCADASASNPNAAVEDNQCAGLSKPATVESCNTQPCLPGAPRVQRVQAVDGHIRVWWTAPSDHGGDTSTLRYVALTSPAPRVATAAPSVQSSPMLVGPLENGVAYTVRLAGVNAAGTGAFSPASQPVTPDKFSWRLSSWSACSMPCGAGGEKTRTSWCEGASVGEVGDEICVELFGAAPADAQLRQKCNEQPCSWVAGGWNTCSRACSTGVQTRPMFCSAGTGGSATIANSHCSRVGSGAGAVPRTSQACNTQPCSWVMGVWGSCSQPCGGGTQTRSPSCANGLGKTNLPLSTCEEVRGDIGGLPPTQQSCNTAACVPTNWVPRPWSACSELCGPGGVQTRSIDCLTPDGSSRPAEQCAAAAGARPSTQQTCNSHACEWKITRDWGTCSNPCHGGTQTRDVVCVSPTSNSGAMVPDARCLASGLTRMTTSRVCHEQACAWAASAFGPCSPSQTAEGAGEQKDTSLSLGMRTRSVWCADGLEQQRPVEDKFCQQLPKVASTESCQLEEGGTGSCVAAPPAPQITQVQGGHEQAVVHFALRDVAGCLASEYIAKATQIFDDAYADSSEVVGGGPNGMEHEQSGPIASSLNVTLDNAEPLLGALIIGDNGQSVPSAVDGLASGVPPELSGLSAWGRASPITVLGLVNGVRYTFVVTAINSIGTSEPSAPSPAVRAFPAPASAPRFLLVSLPESVEDGQLLVFFDAGSEPPSAFADVPAPSYILRAEPVMHEEDAEEESDSDSSAEKPVAAALALGSASVVSVNGSTSPLLLTGLDPTVQYRLSLVTVNPAGSSSTAVSAFVYRAAADASEWQEEGHGDEASKQVDISQDTVSSSVDESRGLSSGSIAAAVLVPILTLLALGGAAAFLWRRRQKERQVEASSDYGRASSNEPSRDSSRIRASPADVTLDLHADAAGELEAPQQQQVQQPAESDAAAAYALIRNARRQVSSVRVDEEAADLVSPDSVAIRVPDAYVHEAHSPGRVAAAGGQASPSDPSDSPSAQADNSVALPQHMQRSQVPFSLEAISGQAPQAAYLSVSSGDVHVGSTSTSSSPQPHPVHSPLSPPTRAVPRMSPPPLLAGHEASISPSSVALSPSPSPSPQPSAPFLRR